MSSFSPWHSGHSMRPRVTVTQTSIGAEIDVIWPAYRLDNKDCTTGRMVHIRRSKWPMAWHKCTCGGGRETSGVGCAIPVWRKSMTCSGVPPCGPVRPGSSSFFHSCLKSISTARMPHWRKTNDTLPLWWCIRKTYLRPPSRLPEPTG